MTTPAETFAPTAPVEDSNTATDTDEELETPAEDTDEESEGGESPTQELSYEGWLEQIESNESLKTEHTTRQEKRDKEYRAEEYRKYQRSISPAVDRWSQNSTATKQALTTLSQTLQKAVRDGNLEPDDVANALNANESALNAFNQQMWWEGSYYLLNTLGGAVESESLANEFLGRLYGMAGGKTDPDFGTDLLSAVTDTVVATKVKEAEERAYQKGLREGQKVNKEQARATSRAGKGPDTAPKSSAAPRYTPAQLKTMTREQLMAIPKEQRHAAMVATK